MAFCGNCGHSITAHAQCSQCGSVNAEAGGLELDQPEQASAIELAPGLSPAAEPSGQGTAGVLGLDRRPQRAAPLRAPQGPSFQEQRSREARNDWRIIRVPVLLILGWFTLSHLVLGSTWVFIDYVNLALHEGGHLLFRPFGTTAHFLGGTLGQLLFPLIFAAYFWRWRQEAFSAAACLWWFGENFIGIARYMADAVVQELPLVGGGVHDWTWLFARWDVLSDCLIIARYTRWLGIAIMMGTLGYLVWRTITPSERDVACGLDAPLR